MTIYIVNHVQCMSWLHQVYNLNAESELQLQAM